MYVWRIICPNKVDKEELTRLDESIRTALREEYGEGEYGEGAYVVPCLAQPVQAFAFFVHSYKEYDYLLNVSQKSPKQEQELERNARLVEKHAGETVKLINIALNEKWAFQQNVAFFAKIKPLLERMREITQGFVPPSPALSSVSTAAVSTSTGRTSPTFRPLT